MKRDFGMGMYVCMYVAAIQYNTIQCKYDSLLYVVSNILSFGSVISVMNVSTTVDSCWRPSTVHCPLSTVHHPPTIHRPHDDKMTSC